MWILKTGLKETSRPPGLGAQVPRLRKNPLTVLWKDSQTGHALRQVEDRLLWVLLSFKCGAPQGVVWRSSGQESRLPLVSSRRVSLLGRKHTEAKRGFRWYCWVSFLLKYLKPACFRSKPPFLYCSVLHVVISSLLNGLLISSSALEPKKLVLINQN